VNLDVNSNNVLENERGHFSEENQNLACVVRCRKSSRTPLANEARPNTKDGAMAKPKRIQLLKRRS